MVQHSTLRRAYFNFILSICGANLQEVFYSASTSSVPSSLLKFCFRKCAREAARAGEAYSHPPPSLPSSPSYLAENKDQLQNILQSIIHYISNDSLAPDQRYGFMVLNKLVVLWVDPYRVPTAPPPATAAAPSPIPGFEQFLYQNAVKACFEVPMGQEFDYSDAQSVQVRLPFPPSLPS
jgi:exportin-T